MKQYMEGAVGSEDGALGKGVLVHTDDGTDRRNLQADDDGNLKVAVVTGGGGGTQYTEEDTDESITGTAMLAEGATNTLKAVKCDDDGAVHVADGGNALSVDDGDGSLSVDDGGTPLDVVEASASAILADTTTIIAALAASLSVDDGSGALSVDDGGGSLSVDDGGTPLDVVEASAAAILADTTAIIAALVGELEVVQGTAADLNCTEASAADIKTASEAVQAAVEGDLTTEGTVAHDAPDAGKPVKTGGKATAAQPAAVGEGDRVNASFKLTGEQRVSEENSAAIKTAEQATQAAVEALALLAAGTNIERITGKYSAAQTNTVLRAVGSGKKWVTTQYEILLDKDCTETAVGALLETGTDRIVEHPGIAPGSGVALAAGIAPIAVGDAADDLLFTCDAATAGNITVHVTGYEIDA